MKCQWCLKSPVDQTFDDLCVCGDCKDQIDEFYKCTVCGCDISENLARFRRKKLETGTCLSDYCKQKAKLYCPQS